MVHFLLAFSLVAVAASASAPAEPYRYSVRNDTGVPYSCGFKPIHSMALTRFVLQVGGEWTHEDHRPRTRTLRCDTQQATPRFYMQPNIRYALVLDRRGRVALR